jgi:acetyl-CoA carboxylase, biotin carboxylase subunit
MPKTRIIISVPIPDASAAISLPVGLDSHVYTEYEIPPYYDSLIGKLIVWGQDRPTAIERMKRALRECAITGLTTTLGFHQKVLEAPDFVKGDIYTNFVEQVMMKGKS